MRTINFRVQACPEDYMTAAQVADVESGAALLDVSAAVQAAYDVVGSGGVVIFQGKAYRLETAPVLSGKSGVRLDGSKAKFVCAKDVRLLTVINCDSIEVTGFRSFGSLFADLYSGNAEQGRIVVENSRGVDIHGNEFTETAGACFIQSGANGVHFHHNRCIDTHSGIQTSSAVFHNLWITDNYFRGHVFASAMQGADDQIAVFGNAAGQTIIARNIIDKQGPTAYNQARAINVSVGSGSNGEVLITENIVRNVCTLTATQARAAILIEGSGVKAASRVTVTNNTVTNCNSPLAISAVASSVIATGNNIKSAAALPGFSTAGVGISANSGGANGDYLIANNIISQCAAHGVSVTSSKRAIVSGNHITDCAGRGVSFDACVDAVVSGNLVGGNQDGIFLSNSQRMSVTGNVATANTRYGIRWQGATLSGVVATNFAADNAGGNYSSGDAGLFVGSNA